jgi:hypothetical protein
MMLMVNYLKHIVPHYSYLRTYVAHLHPVALPNMRTVGKNIKTDKFNAAIIERQPFPVL